MNEWVLNDMIKKGVVSYQVGDEVVVLKRKSNGHPRSIKDGVVYVVRNVDLDGHITVAQHSLDGVGFLQPIRVHKTYMIVKSILRDIKLNSILNETKLI
jgi:hypothetical protein